MPFKPQIIKPNRLLFKLRDQPRNKRLDIAEKHPGVVVEEQGVFDTGKARVQYLRLFQLTCQIFVKNTRY